MDTVLEPSPLRPVDARVKTATAAQQPTSATHAFAELVYQELDRLHERMPPKSMPGWAKHYASEAGLLLPNRAPDAPAGHQADRSNRRDLSEAA